MSSKILRVLQKARYLLAEPEFWNKHGYERYLSKSERDGRPDQMYAYCALGALIKATTIVEGTDRVSVLNPVYGEAQRTLWDGLRRTGNNPHNWRVHVWNDYPGTTHEQVLAAFDAAIEKAEQQEVAAHV